MSTDVNCAPVSEADSVSVASLLENTIRDIGIPPCPIILDQVNSEMRKNEPDFKHLTHIINSDVGISAGLIAITNSPFFGIRNRVHSVNEALMMLGLAVASRAIAGIVFRKLFPLTPSLQRFWHASASIARLSGWLAQQANGGIRIRADDAYTFGLFRDCGIPVLLKRFNHYPEVLKKANAEKELSFTAVEDALCSINHAMIGGLLAQSWWLPDNVSLAIRHHHVYSQLELDNNTVLTPSTKGLIAIAQLAEHLFQHHTGFSTTQEWLKGSAACLNYLGLTENDLELLYDTSATVIDCNE
jgi:HD-like signal output (HDOD) protein